MKRSEALKIIQNILATERSRLIGSEKILSALEKAGMLPPIKSIPERCMCSMRSSCIDCSPSLYKTTWEEE